MYIRLFGLFAFVGLSCWSVTAQPAIEHEVTTAQKPWTGDTPRLDTRNFQFVVVTDNSGRPRPGVFREAIEKSELLQPSFIMSIGDLIDGRTASEENAYQMVNEEWEEFMTYLEPLTVPFFFVPGNHDMNSGDVRAKIWAERFGPSYYYFIYQDVLFLILDSNNYSDEQFAWAKDVLEKHPDVRWTYLFQHHPYWLSSQVRWSRVEEVIEGREKLTIFGGHVHNYVYSEKGNIHYVTMATTGGSSRLRGPDFGEFDHIMYVTVTDEGPVMAALSLDGIRPADYRKIDQAQALRPFNNGSVVTAEPLILESATFERGSWQVRVANPWDKPMRFKGFVEAQEGMSVSPGALSFEVPPQGEVMNEVMVIASDPVDVPKLQPVAVHWEAFYDQFNAAPVRFSEVLRLQVDGVHASTRKDSIVVDGDLGEWGTLPYEVTQPGLLYVNEPAWRGAQDTSFRFAIAHDDETVFVAVDVTDDEPSSGGIGTLQDFGRAMLRALGSDLTAVEPADEAALSIVAGPGITESERGRQERSNRFASASNDFGGTYACKVDGNRIRYEFSIPRASLEKAAGTGSEYLQVNVAINDHDAADARFGLCLMAWKPFWGNEAPFMGVFRLE